MPNPVGLANLGNTCYLNSCVQLLLQISELSVLKHNPNNTVPSACLIDEWHKLQSLCVDTDPMPTFISPSRFVQAVRGVAAHQGNIQFTGFEQNDASEFLYFLLNGWHDACKRPVRMEISGQGDTEKDRLAHACYQKLKDTYEKEYSEIMILFFGLATKAIPTTERPSYAIDIFSMLHVPVCPNLVESIRQYVADGTSFWQLPKYLLIVLNRFSGENARYRKDSREVEIPMRLDMTEFMSCYNPKKYSNYGLIGAVLHMGSMNGGHYVNVVKSGDWFSCNDTCVLLEEGFDRKLSHSNMQRGAYVLLYKRE